MNKTFASCILTDDVKTITPSTSVISTSPHIDMIDNVLTEMERNYLIENAPETQRSTTVNSDTDSGRTSSTAFLSDYDPIIDCITRRVSDITNRDHAHMETPQITNYKKGQKYDYHYDFFTDDNMPQNSQRLTTALMYLKSPGPECGGRTIFPNATPPVHIEPKERNMIVWRNEKPNGMMDESTLHSGESVTCDSDKIGMNIWYRDKPWS